MDVRLTFDERGMDVNLALHIAQVSFTSVTLSNEKAENAQESSRVDFATDACDTCEISSRFECFFLPVWTVQVQENMLTGQYCWTLTAKS